MMQILERQTKHRWNAKASSIESRKALLNKLKQEVQKREADIVEALALDFQKPALESFLTEINPVYSEINLFLSHLDSWSRPKRVSSGLLFLGTRCRILREAKGHVLIISPWNYPFQLALVPLIGAVASGNTVTLKPSELTPKTSQILQEILEAVFQPELVSVIQGDAQVSEQILRWPFDHIFFTGSTRVGKIIMAAASQHLSSVTLELGGKSPVIVDASCDLQLTAQKLAWGKFLNAGQTCVAPDYILVQKSIQSALILALQSEIEKLWNGKLQANLITQKHRDRLIQMLENCHGKVLMAGSPGPDSLRSESRKMPPTLVIEPSLESEVMKEEIFGPVLPILGFDEVSQAIDFIKLRPKPLALYIFSQEAGSVQRILDETSSGGVCINETILHLGNHNLPFGGVGESGSGNYHGEASFRTFTHEKSVLEQGFLTRLTQIFYPPYTDKKLKFLRSLFRLIN